MENATAATIKRFAHCRIKDNPTSVSSEDKKKSFSRQSGLNCPVTSVHAPCMCCNFFVTLDPCHICI